MGLWHLPARQNSNTGYLSDVLLSVKLQRDDSSPKSEPAEPAPALIGPPAADSTPRY